MSKDVPWYLSWAVAAVAWLWTTPWASIVTGLAVAAVGIVLISRGIAMNMWSALGRPEAAPVPSAPPPAAAPPPLLDNEKKPQYLRNQSVVSTGQGAATTLVFEGMPLAHAKPGEILQVFVDTMYGRVRIGEVRDYNRDVNVRVVLATAKSSSGGYALAWADGTWVDGLGRQIVKVVVSGPSDEQKPFSFLMLRQPLREPPDPTLALVADENNLSAFGH
jgi:hypothetical protein